MNRLLVLLAVLFLSLAVFSPAVAELSQDDHLPIGLTEEEKTRLHEIGINHRSTAAPGGILRNSAEWEPSEGVIIRYPLGISYAIVAEMSEDLMVTTIVSSSSQATTVSNYYSSNSVNMANTQFLIAPTDTYWTRDYGPWFIFQDNVMAIVDHVYNRPRPNDDVIPQAVGTAWGMSVFGMDVEHTGGNHMSDGLGTSMSTVLVYNENPSLTHAQIADSMMAYLGNDYTVLDYIEPWGIHHIDCWAKFLNPTTILVKDVPPSSDSYALLNERAEYLSQQVSAWGQPYTVVRVYCPTGTAYTNSLILNDKVLVPIFSSSWDDDALQTYQDAMPGYEILGFTGGWLDDDAIHCRAMGVPDREMLFIDHDPLVGGGAISDYQIDATIIACSGTAMITDSLKVIYRVDGGAWDFAMLTPSGGPDGFEGYIPAQATGSQIEYYLQAADLSDRVETHPYIGAPGAHSFEIGGPDGDGDGIPDEIDNCPLVYNPEQEDTDLDLIGDVCDECTDTDDDGYGDPGFPANTCALDNCPDDYNSGQEDFDTDGVGDVCDECTDTDDDGYGDPGFSANTCALDNCPDDYNSGQEDFDTDGVGDVCDNCQYVFNPDQLDMDEDGIGDACETCCIAPSVGDLDQGGGDLGLNYDGADLSLMINGLFIDPTNGWNGICLDEADVDFTSERPVTDPQTIDGADLSLMIDALFIAPTHFLKNCDGSDN